MTFTHALPTNNYGPAKFIVDASAANGTHTTIASAITAASSGDTIFIRSGSYTENLTLKVGVNLVAWEPDGFSANVNISGTCTHTTAGFVMCAGIRFTTNGAAAIAVTGTLGSKLRLINCYISAANATAITFSSSSVDSSIQIINCEGNTGTTGIGIYTHTAAGPLSFSQSFFTNTGGSSTASDTTGSVTIAYSSFLQPLSSSSAGAYNISYSNLNSSAENVTAFTTAGTGSSVAEYSDFLGGTASAISIGTGTSLSLQYCLITSSNTNAIAGLGTLVYTEVVFNSVFSIASGLALSPFPGTGSWRFIESQTASATASLTFSRGIGTKFNRYMLVWDNVIAGTGGGQSLQLLYNQGGGFVTSGYSGNGVFGNTGGGPGTSTTQTTFAILAQSVGSGVPALSGTCLIGNSQYVNSQGATYSTNVCNDLGLAGAAMWGGSMGNTAALTQFRIQMTAGNIATGTFTLYGLL